MNKKIKAGQVWYNENCGGEQFIIIKPDYLGGTCIISYLDDNGEPIREDRIARQDVKHCVYVDTYYTKEADKVLDYLLLLDDSKLDDDDYRNCKINDVVYSIFESELSDVEIEIICTMVEEMWWEI